MSNRLKITYLDGSTVEATAGARAEVEIERRYNIGFAAAFGAPMNRRREHLLCLGWAALEFSGQKPGEFDAWLERVDDVDVVEGDPETKAEPDPTRSAPRRGNSRS